MKNKLVFSKRGDSLVGQEMFHILERANELERSGEHVNHLELGEPKMYPPGRIINKTIMSLLESRVGYSPSGGLLALRKEMASYYSEKINLKINYQNVVISPANLLIFQFLDIVCETNDTVVLFTPAFPTFIAACNYIGFRTRTVPLSSDDGFQLTKKHVDEALSLKPKTIIINSGNNPTGAVYDEEVLNYLIEKAIQKGCWILSDETYGMLSYEKKFFSLLNHDYEKLIMISSFSKIFSVPGYRIGYAIADSRVIEKIALSSSTLYSCLPIFTQEGIIVGSTIIDEFTKESRKYYKKMSNKCIKLINKSKLISCTKPDSAFYLFIDIRKLKMDDITFCERLLNEFKTAITPGSSFGYKGFVRVSICGDAIEVENGLRQLVLFTNSIIKE